jgi:hypothetical protein
MRMRVHTGRVWYMGLHHGLVLLLLLPPPRVTRRVYPSERPAAREAVVDTAAAVRVMAGLGGLKGA